MTTGSIVLDICKKYRIKPQDFFDGKKRNRKMGRARRAAIEALFAAGFSAAGVARMTRLNYSTIQYWTHPKYRERRIGYYRNLHQKKRARDTGSCPSFATVDDQMVSA